MGKTIMLGNIILMTIRGIFRVSTVNIKMNMIMGGFQTHANAGQLDHSKLRVFQVFYVNCQEAG